MHDVQGGAQLLESFLYEGEPGGVTWVGLHEKGERTRTHKRMSLSKDARLG